MELVTKYFLITVILKDKSVHQGIRKNDAGDVDSCYLLFKSRAEQNYGRGNIIYFQCVQVSKHSDELKKHLLKNPGNIGAGKNQRR